MQDECDDRYIKGDSTGFSHKNQRKVPKRRAAVALKDSEGGQKVPRIAAAGRGSIADKILDLAFENDIKVREDSDLVEMLAHIELDSPIPSEAFMAVGEILSYVYRANGTENPFDTLINDDNEKI